MKINYSLIILLISSLLVTNFIVSEAEVITLTPDTFSDKVDNYSLTDIGKDVAITNSKHVFSPVKEKDTVWFVKFCVPWCKHCKSLGSLWEDLGKTMEGEDEIEIGEVDCGLSKTVCSKVDIHSYPTFKAFYNGEEIAKYSGPRNVESLRTFALEEAQKAEAKAQLESEKEL